MAKRHNKFDYDLIVIGSGAGGSAAATIAARNGARDYRGRYLRRRFA